MSVTAPLGLDAARGADPDRYRVGGTAPRLAVRPADRDELGEALRAAARDGLGVVPWGGGTSLGHELPPARYDVALDTTALDRIVDYDPEDMTVTAECGITLESLGRALAERHQELPIEGGHAGRATLGGTLAANASGARRLRFGAPRDRILGARFALGDGTLARTGGRVVKNVAGYAIHRLLCGSRGALAVFVEASLKVAPAPERRLAILYAVDERLLDDDGRWRAIAAVEPSVTTVLGGDAVRAAGAAFAGAGHVVAIGLEDDGPWVEHQLAAVTAALGAPAATLEGAEVMPLWQSLADAGEASGPWVTFTTADARPGALAPWFGAAGAALVFHAPAGRLHLRMTTAEPDAQVARLAERGFRPIAARGVAFAPPAVRLVAVEGLRGRIRAALDPAGVLVMGERFA